MIRKKSRVVRSNDDADAIPAQLEEGIGLNVLPVMPNPQSFLDHYDGGSIVKSKRFTQHNDEQTNSG